MATELKVTVTHTANLGNFENVKIEVTETRTIAVSSEELREEITDELLAFVLTKGKQVKKKRKSFIK